MRGAAHTHIYVQKDPLSARSSTHRHLCVNRSAAHVCTYVHTHTQSPATQKVQPTRHPRLFLLAISSLLSEALSATNSPSTGSKESQPALPDSAELTTTFKEELPRGHLLSSGEDPQHLGWHSQLLRVTQSLLNPQSPYNPFWKFSVRLLISWIAKETLPRQVRQEVAGSVTA